MVKTYVGIIVDRVRKVTECLIEDEYEGFRVGRECGEHIFTINQIGEKARDKDVECMWVLWTWRKDMIGLTGKNHGWY